MKLMQTGYQNCHLVFCRSVCDIVSLDYVLTFGAVKEYNDDDYDNDNMMMKMMMMILIIMLIFTSNYI